MSELKPCPFCGGEAEIYTGRNFPACRKSLCKTKWEAEERLERYRSFGIVVESGICKNWRQERTGKEKWQVWAVHKGFIPRCLNTKCLGRSAIMMFYTEKEAIEAWNRRAEDA